MTNCTIAVLGAGSWGTALAHLLANKGYQVNLWMRNNIQYNTLIETKENKKYLPGIKLSPSLSYHLDIEKALFGAKIILVAVPTQQVRGLLKSCKQFIKKDY